MAKECNTTYTDVKLSNGRGFTLKCYTTYTRNGMCHHATTVYDGEILSARKGWGNRSWERFEYESTIEKLIEKFPKAMRAELTDKLIEQKYKEIAERCRKQTEAFKRLHDRLTEKQKQTLSNVTMENEEDVKSVMGVMGMMSVMGE